MKIGARTLKTGLAIALSIIVSIVLIPGSTGILAGIAAVTTTMPSVRKSYEMFIKRTESNVIGGIVAVIALYTIGPGPITTGIASIIAIVILNYLKLSDVLVLSVITVVAVMLTTNDVYYIAALNRVLDTVIGVTVTFIINWLVYPPQYDETFYNTLLTSSGDLFSLIRAEVRSNISFSIMHQDLIKVKDSVASLDDLFDLIRGEMLPYKSNRHTVARKYVIYKHMVEANRDAYYLLTALHENDHVYNNFDEDLKLMVRERVEILLMAHEQILMKFEGKIFVDEVNFMDTNNEYRHKYIQAFYQQSFKELEKDYGRRTDVNGVIHLMSAIYAYEEEVLKLNNLIKSYLHRNNIQNAIKDKPVKNKFLSKGD